MQLRKVARARKGWAVTYFIVVCYPLCESGNKVMDLRKVGKCKGVMIAIGLAVKLNASEIDAFSFRRLSNPLDYFNFYF